MGVALNFDRALCTDSYYQKFLLQIWICHWWGMLYLFMEPIKALSDIEQFIFRGCNWASGVGVLESYCLHYCHWPGLWVVVCVSGVASKFNVIRLAVMYEHLLYIPGICGNKNSNTPWLTYNLQTSKTAKNPLSNVVHKLLQLGNRR